MTMLMLLFFAYLFCVVFLVFLNHPLSLALNLFFQTLFLSLILSVALSSPWFSYILFLVFLGGLLVIFAYVATFASNEKFSFSVMNLIGVITLSMVILFAYGNKYEWLEGVAWDSNSLLYSDFVSVSMYSLNFGLVIFLVLYLLLSLIVVVRLNRMVDGPLRSF